MSLTSRLRALAMMATVSVSALALTAHVGSPDTVWEGRAGIWPVRVIIRDPGVIPGLAEVIVRTGRAGVAHVAVTAAVWNADGATPPPDEAVRVPGDSTLWSAHIWFMTATSYGLQVLVSGDQGSGTAVVPFVARATRVTALPRGLGVILSILGLLLLAGMATIVAAAVRESTTPAGMPVDATLRWRARWGAAMTLALLLIVLWLGRGWWGAEASAYADGVLATQPFRSTASVAMHDSTATVTLTITDSAWRPAAGITTASTRRQWSALIPEHGHLMHLMVIADSGRGFAHLHPIATDSSTFTAQLPPLPPGRYRLYGDIVHESGWNQTLTALVNIPATPAAWHPDGQDDGFSVISPNNDSAMAVGDGIRIMREDRLPFSSQEDVTLRFRAIDDSGRTVDVEPFLGMAGHLILTRDSTIYMHLHPSGTPSMAATEVLRARMKLPGDSAMPAMSGAPMPGELAFPYRFPDSGMYRIWVQIRYRGKVRTAGFVFEVR